MKAGVCSVTLASLTAEDVVSSVVNTPLRGIEWWGKAHVPPGDAARAQEVGKRTRGAGLEVAAYGSYYSCTGEPGAFEKVLTSAKALGAKRIRVWAGCRNAGETSADERRAIVADALRIAEMARGEGLTIHFEHHRNTLTEDAESAVRLMRELSGSGAGMSWQPIPGASEEVSSAGLNLWRGSLATLHIFYWTVRMLSGGGCEFERAPLSEGSGLLRGLVQRAAAESPAEWALLEFVRGDSLSQFRDDADVLSSWLKTDETKGKKKE